MPIGTPMTEVFVFIFLEKAHQEYTKSITVKNESWSNLLKKCGDTLDNNQANIEANVKEIFTVSQYLSTQTALWLKNQQEYNDSIEKITPADSWIHHIDLKMENVHKNMDTLHLLETKFS